MGERQTTPENIAKSILVARGRAVLLDVDLAGEPGKSAIPQHRISCRHQVAILRLSQFVTASAPLPQPATGARRNRKRFPADFMFSLSPSRGCVFEITDCDLKSW
jgi:hypothetical protein